MPAASATVSVRMPAKIKARIDRAAKARKASRSEFIMDVLVSHLDAPDPAAEQAERMKALEEFLADLREARKHIAPRAAEDIDAQIREFRGD
jgi:metal-responsive CopG/Arc/MetJ family transcriptional regulator